LELVFCELAWQSGEEERCAFYQPAKLAATIRVTYGFDVSWPECKHSAILQPGVVPGNAAWRGRLNQYGLLQSYSDAIELRSEYLAAHQHPPFDVFVVHGL
jgi:hypothetical protein